MQQRLDISRILYGRLALPSTVEHHDYIIDHLTALHNVRMEEREIGCTLLFGSRDIVDQALPMPSPILEPKFNVGLADLDRLFPYYDSLDEKEHAFCFTPAGEFFAIRRLINPSLQLAGISLLKHMTAQTPCVAFTKCAGQKSVKIYSNGSLDMVFTLSEATGHWSLKILPDVANDFQSKTRIDARIIAQVLEIVIELMCQGHGALLIVTDSADAFSGRAPSVTVRKGLLGFEKTNTWVNLAKQDGAFLISRKGEVIDVGFGVEVDQTIKYPVEFYGHTRHITGYRISTAQPDTFVVSVSKTGRVTTFYQGQYAKF